MNCEKCNKGIGRFTNCRAIKDEYVVILETPCLINGEVVMIGRRICVDCLGKYAKMSDDWFKQEDKIDNVIITASLNLEELK